MALSAFSTVGTTKVQAADFSGQLESADSVTINGNVATVSFNGGAITGKITFLEDGIFRYNVDPAAEFSDYPTVRGGYSDTGKIVAQSDNSDRYTEPADTSASMPIAPYACVTLLAAGAAFVSIRKKRTAK